MSPFGSVAGTYSRMEYRKREGAVKIVAEFVRFEKKCKPCNLNSLMPMDDSRPNDKLTLRDFYEQYWHCRDFEIKNLWQRSIFLGTFLVLCYTGYGVFFGKAFLDEHSYLKLFKNFTEFNCPFEIKHVIAMVLAFIGVVFSRLWIAMAKASKAWYEIYERAIVAIEKEMTDGTEFNKIAGFGYTNFKNYAELSKKFDNDLNSLSGGTFSPSKINIIIGQVSLWIWMFIFTGHLLYCVTITITDALANYTFYSKVYVVLFVLYFLLFMIFISFAFNYRKNDENVLPEFNYESDVIKKLDPYNVGMHQYKKELDKLDELDKAVENYVPLFLGTKYKKHPYIENGFAFYVYEIEGAPFKIDMFIKKGCLDRLRVVLKYKNNEEGTLYSKEITNVEGTEQIKKCFCDIKGIVEQKKESEDSFIGR